MKKISTLPAGVSRWLTVTAAALTATVVNAQNYSWVNNYASASNERGNLIATAPLGGNYCVVTADGAATFGTESFTASGQTTFLIRHNAGGDLSWAKQITGVGVTAIEALDEHVYLACNYTGSGGTVAGHQTGASAGESDACIVRVTKLGVVDLVITLSGTDHDHVNDIDVDSSGNIFITGRSSDSATFAGDPVKIPGMPAFVAKFTAAGSLAWVTKSAASDGLRLTTNKSATRIFALSHVQSEQTITFSNSSHTFTEPETEYGSYFLWSLGPDGTLIKTNVFTGSFRRMPNTLDAPETDFFYVMLDEMYDAPSIWKFDYDLTKEWVIDGPVGILNDNVSSLASDLNGNFYLTGSAFGFTIDGVVFGESGVAMYSSFVVKYSNSGDLLWVTGIESQGPEVEEDGGLIRNIDTDDLNDVYITGYVRGAVNYLNHSDYNSAGGSDDFFVARLEGMSYYESVSENHRNRLQLFPTVNNGHFTISTSGAGNLAIHDISGRVVHTEALDGSATENISCNLQAGLYLVTVVNGSGDVRQSRIIVTGN